MSPWLYLVLAHVVADFVLQPYELVKLKQRPIGLWIHSAIHGLLAAAVIVTAVVLITTHGAPRPARVEPALATNAGPE